MSPRPMTDFVCCSLHVDRPPLKEILRHSDSPGDSRRGLPGLGSPISKYQTVYHASRYVDVDTVSVKYDVARVDTTLL